MRSITCGAPDRPGTTQRSGRSGAGPLRVYGRATNEIISPQGENGRGGSEAEQGAGRRSFDFVEIRSFMQGRHTQQLGDLGGVENAPILLTQNAAKLSIFLAPPGGTLFTLPGRFEWTIKMVTESLFHSEVDLPTCVDSDEIRGQQGAVPRVGASTAGCNSGMPMQLDSRFSPHWVKTLQMNNFPTTNMLFCLGINCTR
ncbi:hypothetical protein F1880_001722 [Penicillium rolfsii]|nr:hypothetical protein F1880_001722 [Penicillium rolfsii]